MNIKAPSKAVEATVTAAISALSEFSFPLPGIEHQPEGATSCQVFLPATPAGDWFRPVGSSLLV
jgi:hypothetical protein